MGKVRPSKYETLLQRPVEELGEDESFLGKYIQRKQKILANRKKIRENEGDIEEFADRVVEKEMERLQGDGGEDDIDYEDGYEDEDDEGDEEEEIGDMD